MSDLSRNAVFLEEMGVGPLWRRRDGVAPDVVHDVAPAAAPAAVAQAQPAFVAKPASMPAVSVPEVAPMAEAPLGPVFEPVAKAQPAPALGDDSTAWFDDAEPPPPAAPVSDQAIAAMGWMELKAAVAKCTRCELCKGRKGVVPGRGAQQARWLIVGAGPSRADEKEARPVSGEAGKLLDNMLRAIDVDAAGEAYVTNLVKCRPTAAAPGEYAPTVEQAAACRPYLERELELTGARSVVTLGQPAAAGLLGQQAASRGVVRQLGAAAVVATYHPQDLLGQSAGKARAWADLCLAKSAHGAAD
jgi:uracil-DNA glycosylase